MSKTTGRLLMMALLDLSLAGVVQAAEPVQATPRPSRIDHSQALYDAANDRKVSANVRIKGLTNGLRRELGQPVASPEESPIPAKTRDNGHGMGDAADRSQILLIRGLARVGDVNALNHARAAAANVSMWPHLTVAIALSEGPKNADLQKAALVEILDLLKTSRDLPLRYTAVSALANAADYPELREVVVSSLKEILLTDPLRSKDHFGRGLYTIRGMAAGSLSRLGIKCQARADDTWEILAGDAPKPN